MEATWTLLLALMTAANQAGPAAAVHFPAFKSLRSILAPRTSDDCEVLNEGFTAEEEQALVKQHNLFRSSVATGKVEKFPKSANMTYLKWLKPLATEAQNTAQFCDPSRQGNADDLKKLADDYEGGIAQNTGSLFIKEADQASQKGFAILQNWFKARDKFDVASLEKYAKPPDADAERFAQLIWAKTLHIGCGYLKFKSKSQPTAEQQEILVCNYHPAGRVLGEPVYEKGEPCSKCVEFQHCNEETKLCRDAFDEAKEHQGEGGSMLGVIGIVAAVIAIIVAVAGVCCMRRTRREAAAGAAGAEGAAPGGGAGEEGAALGGSKEHQKTEASEGIGSQEAIAKNEG